MRLQSVLLGLGLVDVCDADGAGGGASAEKKLVQTLLM